MCSLIIFLIRPELSQFISSLDSGIFFLRHRFAKQQTQLFGAYLTASYFLASQPRPNTQLSREQLDDCLESK